MKSGKFINLNVNEQFKCGYGTVDSKNLKSIDLTPSVKSKVDAHAHRQSPATQVATVTLPSAPRPLSHGE